jgi:iron(II)-dependent oxidoreductase
VASPGPAAAPADEPRVAAAAVADATLAKWVADARLATLDLVADLDDEQLMGPRLAIVNPLLWEIGHVAWFQERWALRHARGEPPLRADGDALYDSSAIPHDDRWDLPLPGRDGTIAYLEAVRDRVLETIAAGLDERGRYFVLLALFHEDMHTEAFTYARQTLAYPPPRLRAAAGHDAAPAESGPFPGDAPVPGGTYRLGAERDGGFVFDNEKWAHPVALAPFAIARAPVTQAEFAAFVDDGGYRRRELWGADGWEWREAAQAEHPVYWRRDGGGWARRDFDRWVALEPHQPVVHVNWHEAEAWCRWAGRRLPTEAEWEAAAAGEPDSGGRELASRRRRFPWGERPPEARRARTDWRTMGRADVAAFPDGDSACGCRQLVGNVWEWTADDFFPYPGFVADPYRDYSAPWFGSHKVLRGGAWTTRGRLLRNTWRNYYRPERRDVWAGFRTCAVE